MKTVSDLSDIDSCDPLVTTRHPFWRWTIL